MNGGLIFESLLIVFCVFLLQTRETEHPVHHCIVDRAYCYSGNKQCPQRNLPYSWWYGHIQPPFYCPDRHLNSPSLFIHSVGFSFGRIWSLWLRFTNEDRAVHFRIFPTSCWFWEVHRGKQLISCAEYYSDGEGGRLLLFSPHVCQTVSCLASVSHLWLSLREQDTLTSLVVLASTKDK